MGEQAGGWELAGDQTEEKIGACCGTRGINRYEFKSEFLSLTITITITNSVFCLLDGRIWNGQDSQCLPDLKK